MSKHVLIVGEGAGKMKEKIREMFRAVEVGKDTLLFDEPSLAEAEKEFQFFAEMHRAFCEELGVASAKVEQKITAREIVEAAERLRALRIKPLSIRKPSAEMIEKLIEDGPVPAYEPMFEPRIIPYDPPPYRKFYDEFRMAAILGSFAAEEALVIKNLKICPKCGCPMQGVDVCPDCGNEIVEG